MDRWGRKTIQILGFVPDGGELYRIAFLGNAGSVLTIFIILYCANYFFTEFGPNTTTFVLPAEIFPVSVRTTCHGISATAGKVGAAVGTFSFRCCRPSSDYLARCGSRALRAWPARSLRGVYCPSRTGSIWKERRATKRSPS